MDSIGYQPYLLQTGLFSPWYMSDRSPSVIPTAMPTISVMSDEAPGSEDGGRISTVTGALQGNSAVPDLNALTSAAPSLEGIFYPANISPFVAACTLDVTKNITRFTNSTFR